MNLLKRFATQNMKKKEMNKRGQFYLIAAMIIVMVIIGLAVVSNYAKKKSSVKIYDLKDELEIESGEVLEHGISYSSDLENTIASFIDEYQEYAGEDRDLYFVYGDFEKISILSFREILVTTEVVGEGKITTIVLKENVTDIYGIEKEKEVVVTINGLDYPFELKPGENFFFIISQEIEGEKYVVTS